MSGHSILDIVRIISFIWFHHFFGTNSPLVEINNGTLQGLVLETRNGREYFSFKGIPYALPPLGELRFEPPKPAASWSGILPAKSDGGFCPQRDFSNGEGIIGNEDCLYLNVYTPKLPISANDHDHTNYPVMIWFHGGAWSSGASHSLIYGPQFFLDNDVVLVTVNYRLGPLGFLSMEDSIVPGNQALKDQAQAIRWVSENIAAFGGDPNSVTLFGQSAGAVSSHLHMISSLSRGLFHRAILQSGTVFCPWVHIQPGTARNNAKRLGEYLNCPTSNSSELVTCLREKNINDIVSTDRKFQMYDYVPVFPFGPVIESDHSGAFLKENPTEAIKNGNIADIPLIIGMNSHEAGLVIAMNEQKNENYFTIINKNWMKLAPMILMYENSYPKESQVYVSKKIREFYFGNKTIDQSKKFDFIDVYSDAVGNAPAEMTVKNHFENRSSPIFYYSFAYQGTTSITNVFGSSEEDYGVVHGDELQYLFPIGELVLRDLTLDKKDHRIVDLMTHLWFNFAKNGNPTPEITPAIPVKWEPVKTKNLEYFQIEDSGKITMSKNRFAQRMKFWESVLYRGSASIFNEEAQYKDEL